MADSRKDGRWTPRKPNRYAALGEPDIDPTTQGERAGKADSAQEWPSFSYLDGLARCPDCNSDARMMRRWVHNAAYLGEKYQGWTGSHMPCDSPWHEARNGRKTPDA